MRVIMDRPIRARMKSLMRKAGNREIGGIIMAEEVDDAVFRISDFSVDTRSGTETQFARTSPEHDEALNKFFANTENNFSRYNYLGEWHTHPRFSTQPSMPDILAMQQLVQGSDNINFAILLIARLSLPWKLQTSCNLFLRSEAPQPVDLAFQ